MAYSWPNCLIWGIQLKLYVLFVLFLLHFFHLSSGPYLFDYQSTHLIDRILCYFPSPLVPVWVPSESALSIPRIWQPWFLSSSPNLESKHHWSCITDNSLQVSHQWLHTTDVTPPISHHRRHTTSTMVTSVTSLMSHPKEKPLKDQLQPQICFSQIWQLEEHSFSDSPVLWPWPHTLRVSNGRKLLLFELLDSLFVLSQVELRADEDDGRVGTVMRHFRKPFCSYVFKWSRRH